MNQAAIPIGKLRRRDDARKCDDKNVRALMESIREIGLLSPLRVRRIEITESGRPAEGYEIIAGAHRYEAVKGLRLPEVDCVVVDDDDLRAELSMIDENLCRAELGPAERAKQTARRKEIYLELHPETAHGVNQHSGGVAKFATPETPTFAEATAAVAGTSERVVHLDAERGKKVIDEVVEMIRGTKLDTGKYLDKLKNLPPNEQVAAAKRDLAQLHQNTKKDVQRRQAAKIDGDVKARAAKEVAEIIAEHVPGDAWDGVKANLYAAGAKNIADALTNITGQSIMDRRYGS